MANDSSQRQQTAEPNCPEKVNGALPSWWYSSEVQQAYRQWSTLWLAKLPQRYPGFCKEDYEDAIQEAWLRTMGKMTTLESLGQLYQYVFTTLDNLMKNCCRRSSSCVVEPLDDNIAIVGEDGDTSVVLRLYLQKIRKHVCSHFGVEGWALLWLRVEGWTLREISAGIARSVEEVFPEAIYKKLKIDSSNLSRLHRQIVQDIRKNYPPPPESSFPVVVILDPLDEECGCS